MGTHRVCAEGRIYRMGYTEKVQKSFKMAATSELEDPSIILTLFYAPVKRDCLELAIGAGRGESDSTLQLARPGRGADGERGVHRLPSSPALRRRKTRTARGAPGAGCVSGMVGRAGGRG